MDSSFLLQLGIVVAVLLLIAASTIGYTWKASHSGPEPIIRASLKELQKGWCQVDIVVANHAPYGVFVDELRRVRPRAARLMAPIKQVSTREGEFQVWSHPSTDKATTSIPLDLSLGPHDARGATVSQMSEGHVTAWLFLPKDSDPAEVMFELAFLDGSGHLRCYRFTAPHVRQP